MKIFQAKGTTILIHVMGWLLFLAFPLLFMNSEEKGLNSWTLLLSPYYWLFCLTYVTLFYLNTLVFIPRYVFRKHYLVYSLILAVLFGCVYYLQPYDNLLGHNQRLITQLKSLSVYHSNGPALPTDTNEISPAPMFGPLPHQDLRMQDPNLIRPNGILQLHQSGSIDTISLFILMMIIGIGVATSTVQQWQYTEQKVVRAEAEKATAELSFLKAQISPHFLFNTLNNIYTLSVTHNEHTPEAIMKLSSMMRYLTDEVSNQLVPLENEINCIHNYIDLQRLRLSKNAIVNFHVEGEPGSRLIAPLILMTFIENAFKYGISKKEQIQIEIRLYIHPREIIFYCSNRVMDSTGPIERTGIGLANTRQRLQQLYSGKHLLTIENENRIFQVKLIITE